MSFRCTRRHGNKIEQFFLLDISFMIVKSYENMNQDGPGQAYQSSSLSVLLKVFMKPFKPKLECLSLQFICSCPIIRDCYFNYDNIKFFKWKIKVT